MAFKARSFDLRRLSEALLSVSPCRDRQSTTTHPKFKRSDFSVSHHRKEAYECDIASIIIMCGHSQSVLFPGFKRSITEGCKGHRKFKTNRTTSVIQCRVRIDGFRFIRRRLMMCCDDGLVDCVVSRVVLALS